MSNFNNNEPAPLVNSTIDISDLDLRIIETEEIIDLVPIIQPEMPSIKELNFEAKEIKRQMELTSHKCGSKIRKNKSKKMRLNGRNHTFKHVPYWSSRSLELLQLEHVSDTFMYWNSYYMGSKPYRGCCDDQTGLYDFCLFYEHIKMYSEEFNNNDIDPYFVGSDLKLDRTMSVVPGRSVVAYDWQIFDYDFKNNLLDFLSTRYGNKMIAFYALQICASGSFDMAGDDFRNQFTIFQEYPVKRVFRKKEFESFRISTHDAARLANILMLPQSNRDFHFVRDALRGLIIYTTPEEVHDLMYQIFKLTYMNFGIGRHMHRLRKHRLLAPIIKFLSYYHQIVVYLMRLQCENGTCEEQRDLDVALSIVEMSSSITPNELFMMAYPFFRYGTRVIAHDRLCGFSGYCECNSDSLHLGSGWFLEIFTREIKDRLPCRVINKRAYPRESVSYFTKIDHSIILNSGLPVCDQVVMTSDDGEDIEISKEEEVNKDSDGYLSKLKNRFLKIVDSFTSRVKGFVHERILEATKYTINTAWECLKDVLNPFLTMFKSIEKFINDQLEKLYKVYGMITMRKFSAIDVLVMVLALYIWKSFDNTLIKCGMVLFVLYHFELHSLVQEVLPKIAESFGFSESSTMTSLSIENILKLFTGNVYEICAVLVTTLVVGITTYSATTCDRKALSNMFVETFKNFHFTAGGILGLTKIFPLIKETICNIVAYFKEKIYGKNERDEVKAKEEEWISTFVATITYLDNEHGINLLKRSVELQDYLKTFYPMVSKIMKNLFSKEYNYSIDFRTSIKRAISRYMHLYSIIYRIRQHGSFRPTPFHIQFVGRAGIGKSSLLNGMVKFIGMKYFPDIPMTQMMYSRGNTDHFDGYNGQPIMLMDDVWKVNDAKVFTESLNLISNVPTILPMANLEDKATFFSSEFVLSTTNTVYPIITDVLCREAVFRRRHILAEVVCDMDVIDKSSHKWDEALFIKKYGNRELANTEYPHLKFNILKPVASKVGEKEYMEEKCEYEEGDNLPAGLTRPLSNLTYKEFITKMEARYECMRHEEQLMGIRPRKRLVKQTIDELIMYSRSCTCEIPPQWDLSDLSMESVDDESDVDKDMNVVEDFKKLVDSTLETIGVEGNNAEMTSNVDLIRKYKVLFDEISAIPWYERTAAHEDYYTVYLDFLSDPDDTMVLESIRRLYILIKKNRETRTDSEMPEIILVDDGKSVKIGENSPLMQYVKMLAVRNKSWLPVLGLNSIRNYVHDNLDQFNNVNIDEISNLKIDFLNNIVFDLSCNSYIFDYSKFIQYKKEIMNLCNDSDTYYAMFKRSKYVDNVSGNLSEEYKEWIRLVENGLWIFYIPEFTEQFDSIKQLSLRQLELVKIASVRRSKVDILLGIIGKKKIDIISQLKYGLNDFVTFSFRCGQVLLQLSPLIIASCIVMAQIYALKGLTNLLGSTEETSKVYFKRGKQNVTMTSSSCISNAGAVNMLVSKNVLNCVIRGDDGRESRCMAVGLFSHYIALNYHSIQQYYDEDKTFEFIYYPTNRSSDQWSVFVRKQDVFIIPDTDVAILWLSGVAPFKDIRKHFIKRKDMEETQKAECVTNILNYGGNAYVENHPFINIVNRYEYSNDKIGHKYMNNALIYKHFAIKGESGGLVLIHNKFKKRSIYGLQSGRHRDTSFASIITQEDIEFATSNLGENIQYEGPLFCDEYGDETTYTSELINTHIDVIGSVTSEKVLGICAKSEFEETIFNSQFSTTSIPAILSAFDSRVPIGVHPLMHSINKYGRDVMRPLEIDRLNHATEIMTSYISRHFGKFNPRILTTHEAILGLKEDGFQKMNNKTSPGIPWVYFPRKMRGKKEWIRYDEFGELEFLSDDLVEAADKIEESFKQDIIPSGLSYEFPKDELRPAEKVLGENIKTRSISVMDQAFTITYRKYFLDFEAKMHTLADGKFSSAVGINPMSMAWTQMFIDLKSVSNRGFDFDVGNWDGHFTPQLFEEVTKIINSIYDDGEENAKIRRNIIRYVTFNHFLFLDLVLRKRRGVPSGFPGTAIFNTIGHLVLFCYIYLKLTKDDPWLSSSDGYLSHVSVKCYGDDIIGTISDKCNFSIQDIANQYRYYGWPVTTATKTLNIEERPVEDLQFLKRTFKVDPIVGKAIIWPLIDESVIGNVLSWMRKSDDKITQLYINIREALEFSFVYGPNYYNIIKGKINKILRDNHLDIVITTYNEMRAQILERVLVKV